MLDIFRKHYFDIANAPRVQRAYRGGYTYIKNISYTKLADMNISTNTSSPSSLSSSSSSSSSLFMCHITKDIKAERRPHKETTGVKLTTENYLPQKLKY